MRKILLFGLALLLLGSGLFADDAKVMPMMVGRVYAVPTFSYAPGSFDSDGKYHSFDDGSVRLFNLGFALEYGIINWITAAVQWTPGWTPWSNLEGATGSDKTNVNGVADLFVGAKLQILGEKAPVQTDTFRFAIAPGVIIPLPGPDFEDELKNMAKGDDATLSSMDNHVFGAGARVYFDYIINEHFFINLYNETIIYPVKKDLDKAGPNLMMAKAGFGSQLSAFAGMGFDPLLGQIAGDLNNVSGEVNYKYRLTFEIEPQYSTNLGKGLIFSAGLPINYRFSPAYDYSLSGTGGLLTDLTTLKTYLGGTGYEDMIPTNDSELLAMAQLKGDAQHSLGINPNVSLFLTSTPLPLEFKFQYGIPVYGQNSMARHNFTLQVKVYFALPGRPQ